MVATEKCLRCQKKERKKRGGGAEQNVIVSISPSINMGRILSFVTVCLAPETVQYWLSRRNASYSILFQVAQNSLHVRKLEFVQRLPPYLLP